MADFRLGRLKFKWRGEWSASTAYVIDDIVKFGLLLRIVLIVHLVVHGEAGRTRTPIRIVTL